MKKIRSFFQNHRATIVLLNLVLLLTIIFLLVQTQSVWRGILSMTFKILMPFIVGIIIAYFLTPLTNRFQRLGLRKSLSILLTVFLVLAVIILLIIFVFPQLYKLANEFYREYVNSTDFGIVDFFKSTFGFDLTPIYNYFVDWLARTIAEFELYVTLNIPSIINTVITIVVTIVFGIAVALYLLSDDGKIKNALFVFSNKINKNASVYIEKIDNDLRLYLGGMFLIAIERFVEYCIIYYLLGSNHYLILALIHGVGVFVPYIGGLLGSAAGVTSLLLAHQGNWWLILLCFAILIFFQYFDEYYVAPKIISKKTKINPLWIIFAFFVGSSLLGILGVLIAVPTFIAVSVCVKTYLRLKEEEKQQAASNEEVQMGINESSE